MRTRLIGVFASLMLLASAFIGPGVCPGGEPKPSDKDVIKAIDASGSLKRADGSFTVVSPLTIAQRGKRNKDGSWPVKVRFTVTYKLGGGGTSAPTETTTSFRIFRANDDAGKPVWKAQLGS